MQRLHSALDAHWGFALLAIALVLGVLGAPIIVPRIIEWLYRLFDPWTGACPQSDRAANEEAFARFAENLAADRRWKPASPEPLDRSHPGVSAALPETSRESELVAQFRNQAPASLGAARSTFACIALADHTEHGKKFTELADVIAGLKVNAPQPALRPFWQMACALEALLRRLVKKPSDVTPSVLRTVANSLDVMTALCKPGVRADLATSPAIRILAVDDDPVCSHTISFALQKFLSPPDLASDGPAGLALAREHPYDAIFLDVEMPGMDGFELCSRIHETAHNKATPVVFVTRHSDFDSRAKSSLCGGRDLIGKPILPFEIAVKALKMVFEYRLENSAQDLSQVAARAEQTALVCR